MNNSNSNRTQNNNSNHIERLSPIHQIYSLNNYTPPVAPVARPRIRRHHLSPIYPDNLERPGAVIRRLRIYDNDDQPPPVETQLSVPAPPVSSQLNVQTQPLAIQVPMIGSTNRDYGSTNSENDSPDTPPQWAPTTPPGTPPQWGGKGKTSKNKKIKKSKKNKKIKKSKKNKKSKKSNTIRCH